MNDLLIHNVGELATALGTSPRRGSAQGQIERQRDVEVVCGDGDILFVGPAEERRLRFGEMEHVTRLDARDGVLVPGFVDSHTHLPWAGSREEEFAQRLRGLSYQAIAAEGGGILATVRATRQASEEDLARLMLERMDRMLRNGTTTAEAKSGYGLTLHDEIKQLRAIREAHQAHALDLVPTLLAAHEVPSELRDRRSRYIDSICEEIIPAAADEGLAVFCDVFCERGVFSVEESRRVLEAGREHGLAPRLHADEFQDSGGAELAAALNAKSADHLIAISDRGIEALAASDVVATLLPGTSFYLLQHHYAPARRLIDAGVAVALATDCNPGSSNTESVPTILTLAIFETGMSVEEALTAVTLNAACSLGLGEAIGSIEAGKQADLLVLDAPNLLHLGYHYGVNPVRSVVKKGRVVIHPSESAF